MKTIKAICFTLLVFAVSTLQAQVIETYTKHNEGIAFKDYMVNYDSLVYIPAQDWSIGVKVDSFYKDDTNQVHAVAQIQIGPDAHLAKAALGYGLGDWHIVNDSVPTITLTAGCTQSVDFVISNTTKPGTIYVLTENKYNSGLNDNRLFYTHYAEIRLPDSLINRTWTSLGMGTIIENGFLGGTGECEFFVCDQDLSRFRIYRPFHNIMLQSSDGNFYPFYMYDIFSEDAAEYLDFRILPSSETGMEGLVMFDNANIGYYHSTYETDIQIIHPSKFTSFSDPSYWIYNKVLYWQENAMPGQVQLAPYYYMDGIGGGWDYTQKNGMITLNFPGYVAPDHSISLQNTHVETQDSITIAVADLALGADVKDARAIVAPQAIDVNQVANDMAKGAMAYISVQSGTIMLPFDVDELGTSNLQLVVAVIENGNAVKVTGEAFVYTKPADENSFVTVGTADYAYNILWSEQDSLGNYVPYWDNGLELQASAELAGVYRIRNWGTGTDFVFQIDTATNRVTVPAQYVMTEETYGDIYTATAYDMLGGYEDYVSTYNPETGEITLIMVYFLTDGRAFEPGYEYIRLHIGTMPDAASDVQVRKKARVARSSNIQMPSRIARMGKPVWAELAK